MNQVFSKSPETKYLKQLHRETVRLIVTRMFLSTINSYIQKKLICQTSFIIVVVLPYLYIPTLTFTKPSIMIN